MSTSLWSNTFLFVLAALLLPLNVLAQNGDGGGVPSSAVLPTTAAQANADGASGSGGGTYDLSTGSTIAIAVVVGVFIFVGGKQISLLPRKYRPAGTDKWLR